MIHRVRLALFCVHVESSEWTDGIIPPFLTEIEVHDIQMIEQAGEKLPSLDQIKNGTFRGADHLHQASFVLQPGKESLLFRSVIACHVR
jgi:hypothetical protein